MKTIFLYSFTLTIACSIVFGEWEEWAEICEIPPVPPPVRSRIENKNYPAIFQPWNFVAETPEDPMHHPWDNLTVYHKRIARNDLYFPYFLTLKWATNTQPYEGLATQLGGDMVRARTWRETQLAHNPNLVFIVQVSVQSRPRASEFPPDSDVLLKNADGQIIDWSDEYHFNILRSEVQQLLIDRIVAFAECGLFDGVMLDGFSQHGVNHWRPLYKELSAAAGKEITDEDIIKIYRHILKGVREKVRPDFLILVNASVTRPERYAEFINGSFMETDRHHQTTREGLMELEAVLTWNEENLRQPLINCLEGRALAGSSHSPENLRAMRKITTLSLTHSDSYVDYTTHGGPTGDRLAPWYDFWDADLGQPIGEKAQRCDNCDGLFVREFTNGWAVYNRSGKIAKIQLPRQATGVASGITGVQHTVPDLDGEIYLKYQTGKPTNINADNVVKVLDLLTEVTQDSNPEWMPDAALWTAVRENLGLSTATPLTKEKMLLLTSLDANDRGIVDITGLELATNLRALNLGGRNRITDLHPLANLINLTDLHIWHLRIADMPLVTNLDISPLVGLINLEVLSLENNGISDISPLAGLKKLQRLHLSDNQIEDFSPLARLTNLWELRIRNNRGTDFSPLAALNLTQFHHDADVNEDGIVNILDLVAVTNAFGKMEPDLNGDGIVNIQDLVIVANAF